MHIDISRLDRADVLVALHEAADRSLSHQGYRSMAPIDRDEAAAMLEEEQAFGYVNGRALLVDVSHDQLDVARYDAANGVGCAMRALKPLIDASDEQFASAVGAMAGLQQVPRT